MLVVPALREDIPAIVRQYQESFPELLTELFGSPAHTGPLLEDLFTHAFRQEPLGFWVTRNEKGVTGYIVCSSNSKRLILRFFHPTAAPKIALKLLLGLYPGLSAQSIRRLIPFWKKSQGPTRPSAAQILSLAVDPKESRQGLGEKLTRQALNYLQSQGQKNVQVEVFGLKTPAVALYRKLGFETFAQTDHPRGQVFWMTRSLEG